MPFPGRQSYPYPLVCRHIEPEKIDKWVRRFAPRRWGTEFLDAVRVFDDVFNQSTDHLWALHADYGHHGVFGNIPVYDARFPVSNHLNSEIANGSERARAMFLVHFGSYLGEWFWNISDGLRTELGAENSALATTWINFWQGVMWRTERFHLGAPYATVLQDTFANHAGASCRGVAILGDPFLREHRLKAVASVSLTKQAGVLQLSWVGVPDATDGYRVYRAASASSQSWTPVADIGSGTNSWTAPANQILVGVNAFMVKSRQVKSTGSGSYVNLSLGVVSNEVFYP